MHRERRGGGRDWSGMCLVPPRLLYLLERCIIYVRNYFLRDNFADFRTHRRKRKEGS